MLMIFILRESFRRHPGSRSRSRSRLGGTQAPGFAIRAAGTVLKKGISDQSHFGGGPRSTQLFRRLSVSLSILIRLLSTRLVSADLSRFARFPDVSHMQGLTVDATNMGEIEDFKVCRPQDHSDGRYVVPSPIDS